jgi:hypothetical protein
MGEAYARCKSYRCHSQPQRCSRKLFIIFYCFEHVLNFMGAAFSIPLDGYAEKEHSVFYRLFQIENMHKEEFSSSVPTQNVVI